MHLHRKNNLLYWTFDNLSACPGVVHGIFTRCGGFSGGPFAGLNVGKNGGDDPAAVAQNRQAIAGCLGNGGLFFLSQVHGTKVIAVEDARHTPGVSGSMEAAGCPEADAAVTGIPGQMLTIQVADCQSVMLHDPVKKAVANIHAGWRGSIGGIVGRCVDELKNRFGVNPSTLVCGIGPSLGPCCAEFIHHETEIPAQFRKYKDEKDRFNFWQITHDQLVEKGVDAAGIEWSNLCTRCNTHLFYSYRQAGTTGRFAAVIGLAG